MKLSEQPSHGIRKPGILFVTGTDTGVGKTYICGLLLNFFLQHGLLAGYQKWVSTGGHHPEDLDSVITLCENKPTPQDLGKQVPFRFLTPASPHLAAEIENRLPINTTVIKQHCHDMANSLDLLLVEGVGGLLVPLHRKLLLADLVAEMDLPIIIVARTGLGSLNHTLLTLEAARSRNLRILGIVLSDSTDNEDEIIAADNIRTIGEIGQTAIFGRMPRIAAPGAARKAFTHIGENILAALL